MSERPAVQQLSTKQLTFLARKLGCFGNRSLLHVGTDSEAISAIRQRGGHILGIVEATDQAQPEWVTVGSPCGSIQVAAHSVQHVLIGDAAVFAGVQPTPESTIALANLLSCLKKRGRLLVPVPAVEGPEVELWRERLSGFPGKLTQRLYKTGVFEYASLAVVLRGIHRIPVLEWTIPRKLISRLEWHKFARDAVMQRMQQSSSAAA